MKKFLTILLLSLPIFSFAHKINLFGYYQDKSLYLEAFFANSNPCSECEFKIYKDNIEIYQDRVDSNGKFEKKINLNEPFEVILNASSGHQAKLTIFRVDKKELVKKDENIEKIDNEVIREIISSELNKQLELIKIELNRSESNFEKIIVGLGYILGIFGFLVLLKRKN